MNKIKKVKEKKYTFFEMSEWILDHAVGLYPIIKEAKEYEEARQRRLKEFLEMARKYKELK